MRERACAEGKKCCGDICGKRGGRYVEAREKGSFLLVRRAYDERLVSDS